MMTLSQEVEEAEAIVDQLTAYLRTSAVLDPYY
jgi:hypothetical protein